jgi:hypothetical protein
MLGGDQSIFNCPKSATSSAESLSLTAEQAIHLRQFVAQVGGLENARRAIEMLVTLRGAL